MGERGPWQWILPGVTVLHNGPITHRQRLRAALKYAGPGAVLTGRTALRGKGVQGIADDGKVHVLVEHSRQVSSTEFVVVERTRRLPRAGSVAGMPVVASVARAVIDAVRRTKGLDDVRAVVAAAVQQRRCTAAHLAAELRACQRRRTALANEVLTEIAAGIRSVAEARAREILRRRGIPEPLWNPTLRTAAGAFIGSPDAYWRDLALALEIDSTAWHLSPAQHRRTMAKHGRYTRHGITVLPYSPVAITDDPEAFADAVAEALAAAVTTLLPGVVVTAADGTAA
ncbi:MAG TPA: hypothetical protein VK894_12985 [Jiangellales bacterium]|nr:hypothetical protein [Jiangellales bacterium]